MSYLGTGNRLKNENQNNLQGLLYFTKLHTNTLDTSLLLGSREINMQIFRADHFINILKEEKKKKKGGEFLVVLEASLFNKDLRSFTALHYTTLHETQKPSH